MQAPFSTLASFRETLTKAQGPNTAALSAAQERNGQLTKPPGALGRLEDLAIWYAGWRGTAQPQINASQVIIFAGNHGVCAQGVSAFPPEVTAQMVVNFQHGGAAINQLSKAFGAKMEVYPLSLDTPTADFTIAPAMTEAEVVEALQTGWNAVDRDADLLVTGEMGVGDTTAAGGGAALPWRARTGRDGGCDRGRTASSHSGDFGRLHLFRRRCGVGKGRGGGVGSRCGRASQRGRRAPAPADRHRQGPVA